jgi:hypothetical protein
MPPEAADALQRAEKMKKMQSTTVVSSGGGK